MNLNVHAHKIEAIDLYCFNKFKHDGAMPFISYVMKHE